MQTLTAPDHLTARLTLPRVLSPTEALAARIKTIRRMAAQGYAAVEIAGAINRTPAAVHNVARNHGIALPSAKAGALWRKQGAA